MTASTSCSSSARPRPRSRRRLSDTQITVGGSAHDSSTLSDATSDAGGTVTYTVYSDDHVHAERARRWHQERRPTASSTTPTRSPSTRPAASTGRPCTRVTPTTSGATSDCLDELLVVGKASPTIATSLSSSSITVGGSVSDSSTLSNATGTAGGSVTYTVYTNNTCTLGARDAGTKTVTNGVVPGLRLAAVQLGRRLLLAGRVYG